MMAPIPTFVADLGLWDGRGAATGALRVILSA
jgi:hypothetical protein